MPGTQANHDVETRMPSNGDSQPPRNISDGQRRDQDHVGVFGEEEHREGHARIFDVEAGDDFRLAFRHVERRAVGLRDAGDEIDQEQRQQRQPEPVQQTALLRQHDLARDSGCRRPSARRPAQSPWRFRRTTICAAERMAPRKAYLELDAQPAMMTPYTPIEVSARMYSRLASMLASTSVSVNGITAQAASAGAMDSIGATMNRKRSGVGRDDDFLHQQLQRVGDRLQPAARPDPVGADAHLHVADDLALGKGQVGHAQHQRQHDQRRS